MAFLLQWRKGLFRLWGLASTFWISLIGWAAYADYTDQTRKMQESCARYYAEHPGAENVCFAPPVYIVPFGRVAHWYIAVAVVPPLLQMLASLIVLRVRKLTHPPAQGGLF